MKEPYYSIVLPAYNEAENLTPLCREINAVLEQHDEYRHRTEVLIIDDGSTDTTWAVVQALHAQYAWIGGIRLRRNCGKATALGTGFAAARGEVIVTMDADLQDDPAEIPRVVSRLAEADVVCGWKHQGKGKASRALPSRLFNMVTCAVTRIKLHDFNCPFKVYRAVAAKTIELYGELHRFIPVLAVAHGFRIVEEPVGNRPRGSGVSKYGWERFARGFLDLLTVTLLTNYRTRPLHLFGTLGILLFIAGGIFNLLPVVEWLVTPRPQVGHFALLLLGILLMLFGMQLVSTGLLAELLISRSRPDARVMIADHCVPVHET